MEYQNRQPPEGINVTSEHPLRQFLRLVVAAIVLLVVLLSILQFTGSFMARRIPFSFEQRVVSQLDMPFGTLDAPAAMSIWLNDLATRLTEKMPMPEGMTVRVHYSSDEVFNAFATVGGNLFFYRGLLQEMPHENAVAMVMAHEIAHVLHRDPVASLGGGVASMVALFALTGNAGSGVAGSVLQRSGIIASAQFTRRMERSADEQALAAVQALYGHVRGADTLFQLIASRRGSRTRVPKWLERFASTHPLDADRIDEISATASAAGWKSEGELTALPKDFRQWLNGS